MRMKGLVITSWKGKHRRMASHEPEKRPEKCRVVRGPVRASGQDRMKRNWIREGARRKEAKSRQEKGEGRERE